MTSPFDPRWTKLLHTNPSGTARTRHQHTERGGAQKGTLQDSPGCALAHGPPGSSADHRQDVNIADAAPLPEPRARGSGVRDTLCGRMEADVTHKSSPQSLVFTETHIAPRVFRSGVDGDWQQRRESAVPGRCCSGADSELGGSGSSRGGVTLKHESLDVTKRLLCFLFLRPSVVSVCTSQPQTLNGVSDGERERGDEEEEGGREGEREGDVPLDPSARAEWELLASWPGDNR
uniref:Uncharacterized protein n=1 Tax=Knipowitschia caucasica TaxID=637954 RepID=A0AAV2M8W8_KNICA